MLVTQVYEVRMPKAVLNREHGRLLPVSLIAEFKVNPF
jgi:hypothetical protein